MATELGQEISQHCYGGILLVLVPKEAGLLQESIASCRGPGMGGYHQFAIFRSLGLRGSRGRYDISLMGALLQDEANDDDHGQGDDTQDQGAKVTIQKLIYSGLFGNVSAVRECCRNGEFFVGGHARSMRC
jgi:hypothetical protein